MAAELVLYGHPGCGSAMVEMALRQAGWPYRVVRTASWARGPRLRELEQLNPLRQIPTLVLADGTVLSESAAILMHIGLMAPASGLLPADPSRRAAALRGMVFLAANCYSAVSVSDYPERWTTDPDGQEAVREAARARLHEAWAHFATLFFDTGLLDGERPGALEFMAVVVSQWSGTRTALKTSRPDFLAWLQRLQHHPAVEPVFRAHWP